MSFGENPFATGEPAHREASFVNRRDELGILHEAAGNPRRRLVVVSGPRRIGKSSVLQEFRAELRGERPHAASGPSPPAEVVLRDLRNVPLPAMSSPSELASALLADVAARFAARLGLAPDPDWEGVEGFARRAVPALMARAEGRRLVLLLDEFECLEDRDERAVPLILDAFDPPEDDPDGSAGGVGGVAAASPLLVASWGRPLGRVLRNEEVLRRLRRGVPRVEIGPLDEPAVRDLCAVAGAYTWGGEEGDDAVAALLALTRGFPLYASAVNHVIYRERKAAGDTRPVTAPEVERAIEPAQRAVEASLLHAWNQLNVTQSRVGRALAALTCESGPDGPGFTAAEVHQRLARDGYPATEGQAREALSDLAENAVAEEVRGEGRYRLTAPFLARWLDRKSYEVLSGPAYRLHREQALRHLAAGNRRMAWEEFSQAQMVAPLGELDDLAQFGGLEAEYGALDEALRVYERAWLRDPERVRAEYGAALEAKARAAALQREPATTWWDRLRAVDPVRAERPDLADFLADRALDPWVKALDGGDDDVARAALGRLVELDPPRWRRRAAGRYAELLARSRRGDGKLRSGLFAVRDALPVLTSEPIPDGAEDAADTALRAKIGADPELLARLEALLRQASADRADTPGVPPWWSETVALLEAAWAPDAPAGLPELPLPVLETLLLRAPEAARDRLAGLAACHLPGRLPGLLRQSPGQAARLVKILHDWCDGGPVEQICRILDEHVTALCLAEGDDPAADDQQVRLFLAHGASLYGWLLKSEASRARPETATAVLMQVGDLDDRMRDPRRPGDRDVLRDELAGELGGWRDLLVLPALAGLPGAASLAARFEPLAPPPGSEPARPPSRGGPQAGSGDRDAREQDLREVLARHNIVVTRDLPLTTATATGGRLALYQGRYRDQPVNIKVYSLRGVAQGSPTERLLLEMWEKERRILEDLASRRSARGLTLFRDAKVDEAHRLLVVMTEEAGPTTLRATLDHGELRPAGAAAEGDLWGRLYWLVEAVHSLHGAGYIHREIRPENVYVTFRGGHPELKLANFEWSIYLQAMTERGDGRHHHYDRYLAPEVLRQWAPEGDAPHGESFASDVYALGLVLFEALVRPLSAEELRRLFDPREYVHADHVTWLRGLLDEVDQRLPTVDERYLLAQMLDPDPRDRMTDLTRAVEVSWRLALGGSGIQQRLQAHTPLLATTLYENTPQSIKSHLEGVVDLRRIEEELQALGGSASPERKQEVLGRFVAKELAGARVFRNGGPLDFPLVLEGRRVTFVAKPFAYMGQTFKTVPYVIVARPQDWKAGRPFAHLPDTLELLDAGAMQRMVSTSRLAEAHRRNAAWPQLFDLADRADDALGPAQRELHGLLALTAEVERLLWDTYVVPYQLVGEPENDGRDEWVWVADLHPDPDLPPGAPTRIERIVSQQNSRENNLFELSGKRHATAPFDTGALWGFGDIDPATHQVLLVREWSPLNLPPPARGSLRPKELEGNRSLFHRRRRLLVRLEDDPFLLKAISEPEQVVTGGSQVDVVWPAGEPDGRSIDADKKEVLRQVVGSRPLHLVQGPPGTGKTTLAAEVIRQVCGRRTAGSVARVLVTAQAHAPLNNLLNRVADKLDPASHLIVRLLSENRLDRQGQAGRADPLVKNYHPSAVASRIREAALRWEPAHDNDFDPALLRAWRRFLAPGPEDVEAGASDLQGVLTDLEARVLRSANVVFVTANDRQLHSLGDDDLFDFLIFEEAAKAYPLEILAPMAHCRQWLLIGDQNQLPPFNIEAFDEAIKAVFSGRRGLLTSADPVTRSLINGLQFTPESADKATRLLNLFADLFERGSQLPEPKRFARMLRTQWRMHPEIGDLVRSVYYPGALVNGDEERLRQERHHNLTRPTEIKRRPAGLNGAQIAVKKHNLIWIDTPEALRMGDLWAERPYAGGYRNPYEAHALFGFLTLVETKGHGGFSSAMLLSPYLAQVELLRKYFASWTIRRNPHNRQTGDLTDKAITVDSAQGREAAVVLVSLVRNAPDRGEPYSPFGFLESVNRSAVMFSRAESLLVVTGSSRHFMKPPRTTRKRLHILQVYDYIAEHGLVLDSRDVISPHQMHLLREHDEKYRQRRRQQERKTNRGAAGHG